MCLTRDRENKMPFFVVWMFQAKRSTCSVNNACFYPYRINNFSTFEINAKTHSREFEITHKFEFQTKIGSRPWKRFSNNFRAFVALGQEKQGNPGPQPAASNMRQLVLYMNVLLLSYIYCIILMEPTKTWDPELAVMAQTHAQQCVFKHDQCRDVSKSSSIPN